MPWDTTTIATLVGTVSAAVGGLLTFAATKGVDAIIRLRKASTEERMEERKHDDAQAKEAYIQATVAYERLIQQFESRVATLEALNLKNTEELKATRAELKAARDEHANCLVEAEKIRGELKALQVHVDRLWKHDENNKANVERLKDELVKASPPGGTP